MTNSSLSLLNQWLIHDENYTLCVLLQDVMVNIEAKKYVLEEQFEELSFAAIAERR